MRAVAVGAAAALALIPVSASAVDSLFSYPWTASAKLVSDDGLVFTVYLHPKHNSLLLQPRMSEILGSEGTKGPTGWGTNIWRHAAEYFVQPIGCGVSDIDPVSKSGATWEAQVVCPPGVDLHLLMRDQHDALLRGEPLHR